MDNIEIGKRIKKYREERGWKQYNLSLLSGVTASYIPDLESGKKCPSVKILSDICDAYGITLAEFFADENKKSDYEQIAGLTPSESKLVHYFRTLPSAKRQAILALIET